MAGFKIKTFAEERAEREEDARVKAEAEVVKKKYGDEIYRATRVKQIAEKYGNKGRENALKRTIGFDTLESDLSSMGKTIEGIYGGWQSADTMKNIKNRIGNMKRRINAYQEYRKLYGGDNMPDLTELSNGYKSILDGWDELSESYAGYKNADEYKRAASMPTADVKALETELGELEGILGKANEYEAKISGYTNRKNTWEHRSNGLKTDLGYGDKVSATEKEYADFLKNAGYSSIDELKREIQDKTIYKNQAKNIQKINKVTKEMESDPRYEEYIASGKALWGDASTDAGLRYNPVEYFENVPRVAKKYEGKEIPAYLLYKHGTEEEKNVYHAFLGKNDENGARGYLELMKGVLNQREADEVAKQKDTLLEKIMFVPKAGLDQFAQGVANLPIFTYNDDYITPSVTQLASGQVRESISDNWKWAYDFGTTTFNMIPSIGASILSNAILPGSGAVVGNTLMGASAIGNAYQEKINSGWDRDQAMAYSTLVGVSEAGLQYALGGIGKLGGAVSGKGINAIARGIDNALGRFALMYPSKVVAEGIEEGLQEILNPVFENLALGYAENDLSDVEWENVAYSAMLGALSAGLFEAGPTARETFGANKDAKRIVADIRNNDKIKYLTDNDYDDYIKSGNQHTQHKKANIMKSGESAILRSKEETDAFIERSLNDSSFHSIRAFSKVNNRMIREMADKYNIDVDGYYLELNSSDILHTAKHENEKRDHQIPLTKDELKKLPEYMVNYDDVLEVKKQKDGSIKAWLGKKINGHSIVITIVSKGRQSMALKTAYLLDTVKYDALFGTKKEDVSHREATASSVDAMPTTSENVPSTKSSSDITISQNDNGVNDSIRSKGENNLHLVQRLEAQSRKNEPIAVEDVKKATGFGDYGVKEFSALLENSNEGFEIAKKEFQPAYELGMTNPEIVPEIIANNPTQRIAFNAGKLDYIANLKNQIRESNSTIIKGTSAGFKSTNNPSDVTSTEVKQIDAMSKLFGVETYWADDLKGNAEIKTHKGVVLLNRDFERSITVDGKPKKVSAVYHAFHEILGHRLIELAPKEGNAFISELYRYMTTDMPDTMSTPIERRRAFYGAQNVSLSTSKAMEEIMASSTYNLLYETDDNVARALEQIASSGNQEAIQGMQKYKQLLTEFLEKLKEWWNNLTGKEKAEAKPIVDEVARLRDMFENAASVAVKRVQEAQNSKKSVNQVENGGKKRYNENISYALYDEEWHTDLNKREMTNVLKWLRQDIKTSTNEITSTANWYKGRLNGQSIFVIYSTLYGDPTILYEVKGSQGEFELNILKDILEVKEYGKSINRQSNVVNAVLSGGWMRQGNSMGNNNGIVGRGRGKSNAAILQGQSSKRNPSPAFRTVVKNLFKEEGKVNYSLKETVDLTAAKNRFYSQLNSWDGETTGFSFVLGTTSKALMEAKVPNKQIRWDATKIKTLLNKHNGMTIETVRQIPNLLENPVVVIDSKKDANARIIMGDLHDANGKLVTVVLLLTPTSKKGNQLDVIKVSSAQGRSHIESLFRYEDGRNVRIRFVDEKRIQSWLNVNRLQLPLHSFNLDSNNSISQTEEKSQENLSEYSLKGEYELYDELIEKYGTIPAGENPHREIQVPKKTSDKKNVSRTVRTILEAKVTPDEVLPSIAELVTKGEFSYNTYTDKEAIAEAEEAIAKKGWETAKSDWYKSVGRGDVSKKNTAEGWVIYNNAVNSGETETALEVLNFMVKHQRSAAQALQATRILKKLSPETQLYGVQKSVQALQKELIDKYGKKAPDIRIDEELAEQFLNAKTPEERAAIEKEIYRDIGAQMPSSFIDKWNAWRYLAMLGNVRTHIRNVVGNAGFAPVVLAKNLTATAIESVVHRVSGKKTVRGKAIVYGSKTDRALLKAAWGDYAKVADLISNGGKYNDSANANQYIEEGRKIFKTKPLELARKGNSKALEAEDMWFARPHYAYALAQYCKANNITAEQLQRGKAIAPAREYAIKEAQKATYRDTNAFSQMVSEWGRKGNNDNLAKKAVSTVIEGTLPFRKTPANILVRGVEYSPIGLIKGLSYDLVQVGKGKMSATEAIDNISAGLTGTGLLALGVYLAAQGLIRGHGEDEEKEKEFNELMGHQAYSLELPNGKSITLDWLAPEALPFFVGVNLWETTKGSDKETNLSSILSAISNISEPMLEMSCLQGLNDLFEGIGYASSNGTSGLVSVVTSAVTSYLTQAIPTIFGQAERTGEENRMTTYTEKNGFLTGDIQYTLGKISAKIPFWDYNQIPYVDAWGRKEASGTALKRGFNNFLNPAYTSEIEDSNMEKELLRLYERTGEGGVFPERADKYFTVDGVRKDLTADEYVRYATLKGQKSYKLVSELVNSKAYRKLSDEEKAKAVKEAYDYANQKAKQAISNYKPESWVNKADEFGSNVGNYISFKTEVSSTEQENGGKISKSEVVDIIIDMAQNDSEMWAMYLSEYDSEKDMYAYNKGIAGGDYMDFLVSLDKNDKPTKSGKYGSYTQEEAYRAIKQLKGLSRQEKAILWQSVNTSWKAKNNPFR